MEFSAIQFWRGTSWNNRAFVHTSCITDDIANFSNGQIKINSIAIAITVVINNIAAWPNA